MKLLAQHIESLVFTSETAISPDEIITCLKTVYGWELTKDDVKEAINQIATKYSDDEFSFELNEIAGGYQFLSKKDYHAAIHVMLQLKEKKRLSTAALETLSIIAYKQPITKPELEQIRGVSCDYSIQKLLEKELIVIAGKSDGPGKPLLYTTSKNFMDHFGLRSVKDLPKLKDIHPTGVSEIGMPSELSDNIELNDFIPTDDETETVAALEGTEEEASVVVEDVDVENEDETLTGEASVTEDFIADEDSTENEEPNS